MKVKSHLTLSKFPCIPSIFRTKSIVKGLIGNDAVIQGSIYTTNIGDLAIALSTASILNNLNVSFEFNGYLNKKLFGIPISYLPDFSNYDYHIIAGGGTMRDNPDYLSCRIPPNQKLTGSMAVSVGCYNDFKNERAIKILQGLDNFKFVTARDEESKNHIKPHLEKDIDVVPCPGFLIENLDFSQKNKDISVSDNNKKTIGINLRPSSKKKYIDFISKLEKFAQNKSKKYEFVFIPFSITDLEFISNFSISNHMKILDLNPPNQTLETIKNIDKMIVTRYHAFIFTILAGKPFLVYDVYSDEKYKGKIGNLVKDIESQSDYRYDRSGNSRIEDSFYENIGAIKSVKNKKKEKAKKNIQSIKQAIKD